jgi:hypothetical protein
MATRYELDILDPEDRDQKVTMVETIKSPTPFLTISIGDYIHYPFPPGEQLPDNYVQKDGEFVLRVRGIEHQIRWDKGDLVHATRLYVENIEKRAFRSQFLPKG